MMKIKYGFLLVAGWVTLSCCSREPVCSPSDEQQLFKANRIKTMTGLAYECGSDIPSGGKEISTFDENGFQTEIAVYYMGGFLARHKKFENYPSGKLKVSTDQLRHSRFEYKYGSDCKISESIGYDSLGKLIGTTEFSREGKFVTTKDYDAEGNETASITVEHNELGRPLTYKSGKFLYEYNSDGNLILETRIDTVMSDTAVTEYNYSGRILSSKKFFRNGECTTEMRYEYMKL